MGASNEFIDLRLLIVVPRSWLCSLLESGLNPGQSLELRPGDQTLRVQVMVEGASSPAIDGELQCSGGSVPSSPDPGSGNGSARDGPWKRPQETGGYWGESGSLPDEQGLTDGERNGNGRPDPSQTETFLSVRQWDVLRLLAEGASNEEISDALSISLNTVKTHMRQVMAKLQTANRTRTALAGRRLLEREPGE